MGFSFFLFGFIPICVFLHVHYSEGVESFGVGITQCPVMTVDLDDARGWIRTDTLFAIGTVLQ